MGNRGAGAASGLSGKVRVPGLAASGLLGWRLKLIFSDPISCADGRALRCGQRLAGFLMGAERLFSLWDLPDAEAGWPPRTCDVLP